MNRTSHDVNNSACRCTVPFGTRPVIVVACPEARPRKYVRENPTRAVHSIAIAMPVQNLRSLAAGETKKRGGAAVTIIGDNSSTRKKSRLSPCDLHDQSVAAVKWSAS